MPLSFNVSAILSISKGFFFKLLQLDILLATGSSPSNVDFRQEVAYMSPS